MIACHTRTVKSKQSMRMLLQLAVSEMLQILSWTFPMTKKFSPILFGIQVVNVQSNGHPPERKPVIMRRKHVWSVERMWVENPTTIQTKISKETKRFSRMVIGFPAADLL